MEQSYNKTEIIEILGRSPHGKLEEYIQPGTRAAAQDPEFFAHFIAWNQIHGAVRDSKTALPFVGLIAKAAAADLTENSLAHIGLLDPRSLVRGMDFSRGLAITGQRRNLRRLVERYLRHREAAWGLWERGVVQHRKSFKRLYALNHIKPGSEAFNRALFLNQTPVGSHLWAISQLHKMTPQEALGQILTRKIPFLVAIGALGSKLKEPDVVLGLINSMTPTELQTNAAMLEKLGIKINPALREAFREKVSALSGIEQERKTSGGIAQLLKTGKAASAVTDDRLRATLQRTQEEQLKAHGGVKGRWLVAGDKSQSMQRAIETAKFIAAHLARMAEEVHLVWFDSEPRYWNATGKTLEEIEQACKFVQANGGTQWHQALAYISHRNIEVDGIIYISDGGDNDCYECMRYHTGRMPAMVSTWRLYTSKFAKEPTLYFFKVRGDDPDTMSPALKAAGIEFDLLDYSRGAVPDYYSLPNILAMLKTRRWSLIDQIMETPLLRLDDVFSLKEKTSGVPANAS